jgi:hypothetical protein
METAFTRLIGCRYPLQQVQPAADVVRELVSALG